MIYSALYLLIGCVNFLYTAITKMRYSNEEIAQIVTNTEYFGKKYDQKSLYKLYNTNGFWVLTGILDIVFWPLEIVQYMYYRLTRKWR